MSKAFTREDDDEAEERIVARPHPALPEGATNWMTLDGMERIQSELHLLKEQRVASNEAATWGREFEQRLVDLEYLLRTVEVVTPTDGPCNEVRFGTTVTVREQDGAEHNYRIVGLDETDADRGWVSWLSPIARALMGARRRNRVLFHFPDGKKELKIIDITERL